MKKKATFYHAGCPVCVEAESRILDTIDRRKYEVEVVHLGDEPSAVDRASAEGVKSVPALTIEGEAFHINFGASIEDLKP